MFQRCCRKEEAREVLRALRQDEADIDEELDEITLEAEQERAERTMTSTSCKEDDDDGESGGARREATWKEVFSCRYQMLVGTGLGVIAAATGVNAIIFYSTQVFAFAGFDEAILATASVGAVNLLATALATYLVDVLGRKQLLEGGMALMTGSLLALALVLLAFDFSEKLQGVLAVVAVLVYVVGFAIGIGAVMWVMMCEILDQRVRSKAFGLFISINWGINLVIGLLTLSAIDGLGGLSSDMDDDEKSEAEKKGVAYLFVIFGGICFLSQVFIRFYVPETRGKSPNDFVLCEESSIFHTISSLHFQNSSGGSSSSRGDDVDLSSSDVDSSCESDSVPLLS
jgi:MFS family permease